MKRKIVEGLFGLMALGGMFFAAACADSFDDPQALKMAGVSTIIAIIGAIGINKLYPTKPARRRREE